MTSRRLDLIAILFADVAKSTQLYEVLGDTAAQGLIGRCVDLMAEVTRRHNGTVIKTIGDEVMSTFDTADAAVEAAIDMQQSFEAISVEGRPGVSSPNIYVGVHFGSVIREGGDVFGDAVNVAARMVAMAKERQVITTEETVSLLGPEHQGNVRCVDTTIIKGKRGEVSIYEVIWERQDVTVMLDNGVESVSLRSRLELAYHDQIVFVDQSHHAVTLGRQQHNDIVVNDQMVSRSHARIEYRRGRFVLMDQSTNGTFAVLQDKKTLALRRDEAALAGSGIIGLGKEPEPGATDVIRFSITM